MLVSAELLLLNTICCCIKKCNLKLHARRKPCINSLQVDLKRVETLKILLNKLETVNEWGWIRAHCRADLRRVKDLCWISWDAHHQGNMFPMCCLQSSPASWWKCVAPHEKEVQIMVTTDYWGVEVLYWARMDKTAAIGIFSSRMVKIRCPCPDWVAVIKV